MDKHWYNVLKTCYLKKVWTVVIINMYEVASGMCKAGKAHFSDQMPLIIIIMTPWLTIALCFDFKAVLTSLKKM